MTENSEVINCVDSQLRDAYNRLLYKLHECCDNFGDEYDDYKFEPQLRDNGPTCKPRFEVCVKFGKRTFRGDTLFEAMEALLADLP